LIVPKHGVINLLEVDNLIDGVFLLIEKGQPGEAYNITDGESSSFRDFWKMLLKDSLGHQRVYGVSKPVLQLFSVIITCILWIVHLFGDKNNFDFTPSVINFLSRSNNYSIEKIRKLGYQPRVNLQEGMNRIKKWVREDPPF